jgi:hypothetical protein
MSEALRGTPAKLAEQLQARYEPLRDSRAHAEPELNQRKWMDLVGYLLIFGGAGVEVFLLVSRHPNVPAIVFGLAVAALGGKLVQLSRRPLQFVPPEPLENLAPLCQGIGLCRTLARSFPDAEIELDPVAFLLRGSYDGYDWELSVDRQGLKPVDKEEAGFDNSFQVLSEAGAQSGKLWRRSSHKIHRHRIVWRVTVDGDFTPRPGLPSPDTSLEERSVSGGKTVCVFTLPVNQPDQPGLGHEGRTDYISSPLGLHHPEFVGEQVAQSLNWMFLPNLRL